VPVVDSAPTYDWSNVDFNVVEEASKSPLDGAIAAAIAMAGTENKIKAAGMSILLIGGTSALKGLGAFVSERSVSRYFSHDVFHIDVNELGSYLMIRLPTLLRAKNIPLDHVSIVPPPRGLNPRFVSWKGASVICNLEGLSDMWIRRDEWEAVGARSLKERCLFL
jgi:actin-related protein 8